ncbi:Uncharacterized protein TPAR_05949, partial [Tolypocladium paradoxum]
MECAVGPVLCVHKTIKHPRPRTPIIPTPSEVPTQPSTGATMPPRRACDVCFKRKVHRRFRPFRLGKPVASKHSPLILGLLRSNALSRIQAPPATGAATKVLLARFQGSHRGKSRTCKLELIKPSSFPLEIKPTYASRVTPDAVHALYRRIEQLEGDLARRNAQAQISSQTSPSDIDTAPRTIEQGGAPLSGHSPSVAVSSFATNSLTSPVGLPRASSVSPCLEPESLCFYGQHLGLNWYFKGMQILSERGREWISSRTGQEAVLDTFLLFDFKVDRLSSTTSPTQFDVPQQELSELPEEHATHKAMDTLYHSSLQFSLPVLDRDLFQETMTKAYGLPVDTNSSQSRVPAKACVWALHAIASRLQRVWNPSLLTDGEKCASRAQALLGLVAEESNSEALQAVLLLQTYRAFTGQWRSSSFLHPLACRMVCDLGGHFFHPQKPHSAEDSFAVRQRHHIRGLFWLCYVLDKDISLRSGRPPLLTEDYCDLTLPEWAEAMSNSAAEELTRQLPNDPRLSMIKEKTCRLLYSPPAFRISDSQLLLNIRQLDDELEQWRLSIPPLIRPRLAIPSDRPLLPPDASISQSIQCINLQLDYHYALTTIHTAVRRCGTTNECESLPEDLHSVVHSSIDLSLEAGRSTLLFLRAPIDILEEGAFRHISFYAPIAAMALFVNILIHPLDARAQPDLELLVAAVGIIQSIPLRALSSYETEHIQRLNDFIMELGRLGS